MIDQPIVHVFVCPCGRQGQALTRKLHDCPCGISRRYRNVDGQFFEDLYRERGYPSEVYRWVRHGEVFELDDLSRKILEFTEARNVPFQIHVLELRRGENARAQASEGEWRAAGGHW